MRDKRYFFFKIQEEKNKRHKRHTRLKALQDKGFRVWRFGRANATNATQTPPNATQTPRKRHSRPSVTPWPQHHRGISLDGMGCRDLLSPATPRPAGSCLQLITAPSSAPPTARRPPLRARWIPPLIWGRMSRRSGSLLVGSVRCYQLQTSSRSRQRCGATWSPRWWGRGSRPNCTPSS